MPNISAMPNSAHICLGVCTYQRPQMLLRCLLTVRRLTEPGGVRLSVLVVDNENNHDVAGLVERFMGIGHAIHYVGEPRRGIAQARNAILDKAAELGATWIAMLDDDQLVSADWLLRMWDAVQQTQADVVYNAVDHELPAPLPVWAFPKVEPRKWTIDAEYAATNGVLFRADLTDIQRRPLRFDEAYALTGGEDLDFFRRAHEGYALIVWTPDAVARETVPASKLTFGAQVHRAFWAEAVSTRQDRGHYGFLLAAAAKSLEVVECVIGGACHTVWAPFAALGGERRGRRHLLRGVERLAQAAGIAGGLGGVRPEPYRTIHGC